MGVSDTLWKWQCKLLGTGDKWQTRPSARGANKRVTTGSKASPPEEQLFGADALVKILYESKDSTEDYRDWVDYPPKQQSKSASRAQDRAAIKIYKIADKAKPIIGGRPSLKYFIVEIQSPLLVAAIKDIVKKSEVYLEPTAVAEFREPFAPLFFHADEIAALLKDAEKGSPLQKHLELLLDLMDDMFEETRNRVKPLQASGLVSFDLLWAYLPTGSPVYIWDGECEFLGKVVKAAMLMINNRPVVRITCRIISFDGEVYVWEDYQASIAYFSGNIPITNLSVYPLKFHSNPEAIRARFLKRARKALDYQGITYGSYTGVGLVAVLGTARGPKHIVDGRIMIDTVGYNKQREEKRIAQANGDQQDKLASEPKSKPVFPIDGVEDNEKPVLCIEDHNETWTDADSETDTPPEPKRRITEEDQQKNKKNMLSLGEDLVFVSPLLKGYALKNKTWLNFHIEDIGQVQWNNEAYDHLVYDEQQKDLILSFVEDHYSSRAVTDDVIRGKGQGLSILLSGPPGTGKTLTAEAVADRCRKPLFYLQAEDLGIDPTELGKNIKSIFQMALDWNAVILLDEGDVFMAERNPNDVHRNELVSIFLREIEYYNGVLFLTTNLFNTIDTAFRSRINIHLQFESLSPSARLKIWKKFLERLSPLPATAGRETEKSALQDLDEEELNELSMWQLNGREIKNVVRMVKSWCDLKGYDLTLSRIESAIKVTAPLATKRDHSKPADLYS